MHFNRDKKQDSNRLKIDRPTLPKAQQDCNGILCYVLLLLLLLLLYFSEVAHSGCKRLCRPVILQVTSPQGITICNLTKLYCDHTKYSLRNDLLSFYCSQYHTRGWLVLINLKVNETKNFPGLARAGMRESLCISAIFYAMTHSKSTRWWLNWQKLDSFRWNKWTTELHSGYLNNIL